MADYRKLLVAIDLSGESDRVIEKALSIVDGDSARVSLIHVVEPVAAAYPIDAYAINMSELQEESMRLSAQRLTEFADKYVISTEGRYTAVGSAATEIRSKADEIGADLIVIGSHGTSGWKLLLGSTANKVLHGANCDILTVRVGN
jgi:universal stress protein A